MLLMQGFECLRDTDSFLLVSLIRACLAMANLAQAHSTFDQESVSDLSIADHQIYSFLS